LSKFITLILINSSIVDLNQFKDSNFDYTYWGLIVLYSDFENS